MKSFIFGQNIAFASSPFTVAGVTIAFSAVVGSVTPSAPQGVIDLVQVRFPNQTTRWVKASQLIRVF